MYSTYVGLCKIYIYRQIVLETDKLDWRGLSAVSAIFCLGGSFRDKCLMCSKRGIYEGVWGKARA